MSSSTHRVLRSATKKENAPVFHALDNDCSMIPSAAAKTSKKDLLATTAHTVATGLTASSTTASTKKFSNKKKSTANKQKDGAKSNNATSSSKRTTAVSKKALSVVTTKKKTSSTTAAKNDSKTANKKNDATLFCDDEAPPLIAKKANVGALFVDIEIYDDDAAGLLNKSIVVEPKKKDDVSSKMTDDVGRKHFKLPVTIYCSYVFQKGGAFQYSIKLK